MQSETPSSDRPSKYNIRNYSGSLIVVFISTTIALAAALAAITQSYFSWLERDNSFKAIIFTAQMDAFADYQANLQMNIDGLSDFRDSCADLLSLFDQIYSIGKNNLRPSKRENEIFINKIKSTLDDMDRMGNKVADREINFAKDSERIKMLFPERTLQDYDRIDLVRLALKNTLRPLLEVADTFDSTASWDSGSLDKFGEQIKTARRSLNEMNQSIRELERIATEARNRMQHYLATNRFAQKYTSD